MGRERESRIEMEEKEKKLRLCPIPETNRSIKQITRRQRNMMGRGKE